MSSTTHPTLAVNIMDASFFKDLGSRIARARKERNLTQVQLAATLGIAQQTLAHHEGGRLRLPASLPPVLARYMERISALPKKQRKFVMQMIGTMLAQQVS